MLPRRLILIAATLTAFVLSIVGGVAMALRPSAAAPSPTPMVPTVFATATPQALSPQEAASLAASVFNQTEIYRVESSSVNGVDAYKVVFSSGSVAYVGLDGRILSVAQVQPTVVMPTAAAPFVAASNPAPAAAAPAPSWSGEHEDGGDD